MSTSPPPPPAPAPITPAKTQGLLLRGYRLSFVRHFALSVNNLDKARTFLRNIVNGTPDWPQITTAEQWPGPLKPVYCLNISFTYQGLIALGVQGDTLASFDTIDNSPFVNGSAASAETVGDVAGSDPTNWILSDQQFHVMLTLFAHDETALEAQSALLWNRLTPGFSDQAHTPVFDSQELYDANVYFGYRDGIAQPIIAGSPFASAPDGGQTQVDPGAFMLGTATTPFWQAMTPLNPPQLGLFGCFAAFRLLRQDVDGFKEQLKTLAPAFGAQCDPPITDLVVQCWALMAKMCGRWPNGTPLALWPINGDTLPPDLPRQQRNDYLYILPDTGQPDDGRNCPIGAHMRRGNMRGYPNDAAPENHRILRRAGPYQKPYNAKDRDSGDRGLVGFFLGASLVQQFEFVQQNWINPGAGGFDGVLDTTDPVMGTQVPDGGHFYETLRTDDPRKPIYLSPMNSFVTTIGSAYCFFPGIDGIDWLGSLTTQPNG